MTRHVTFTVEAVVEDGYEDRLTRDLEVACHRAGALPRNFDAEMIGNVECVFVTGRISRPTMSSPRVLP